MTNEEILEKQVEALEKLLQLRSALIEDLETKISKLESDLASSRLQWPGIISAPFQQPHNPVIPYPNYPWQSGRSGTIIISTNCPDGTSHTYPQTWSGTAPLSCTKCGAQQNPWSQNITLTGANIVGNSPTNKPPENIFTLKHIEK